ncbi:cysteine-rich venom protein 1-like isoform X1 [Ceratina calcarata]|uniref:Cysteine-rich venom protein 1-like isoform X1 n=1 Tax=Ceratina calcarata TaxID=156304 RepID=A0AAJ7NDB1_9HYME|nr:cysteine-rich venom protein 1-like isoform X1 [Ceratina calcarata]
MFRSTVLCILFVTVVFVLERETMAQGSYKCSENSTFNPCGTLCEPSCGNPYPDTVLCSLIPCVPAFGGCRCNDGYVRDSNTTQCITFNQCPPP